MIQVTGKPQLVLVLLFQHRLIKIINRETINQLTLTLKWGRIREDYHLKMIICKLQMNQLLIVKIQKSLLQIKINYQSIEN